MKLSILDQSPISTKTSPKQALQETIKLSIIADKLGYTRYWVAEHHDLPSLACPSPEILLSQIGSVTKNIRIGSGAVLLPHYKPYKVAENFNMLTTLYPGRIDLGIGRAPGGPAEATMALSKGFLSEVKQMPNKVKELLQFIHHTFPKEHLYKKVTAHPMPEIPPDVWLLGTSDKSAKLAASFGVPFAFGHFMSNKNGPEIVKEYKTSFKKSKWYKDPKAIVAVSVICAETTAEANRLALSMDLWKVLREKQQKVHGIPSVKDAEAYSFSEEEKRKIQKARQKMIIGNPKEVKKELFTLKQTYNADEIMIVTITHDYKARIRSYELIAKEIL